jgi:hypothetical protein
MEVYLLSTVSRASHPIKAENALGLKPTALSGGEFIAIFRHLQELAVLYISLSM